MYRSDADEPVGEGGRPEDGGTFGSGPNPGATDTPGAVAEGSTFGATGVGHGQAAGMGIAPAADHPEAVATFLHEVARAMRSAADQERDRILGRVAEQADGHEEKARTRGRSETSELERLADEDIDGIHAWSKAAMERIQAETESKIQTRRERLERSLVEHGEVIETEIARMRGAVEDYRAELDRFFVRLGEESDPAEIARMAGMLPAAPDLDAVGATARADALAGIAGADRQASRAMPAPAPEPEVIEAVTEPTAEPETGETGEAAEATPAEEAVATDESMAADEVATTDDAGATDEAERQAAVGVMDPDAAAATGSPFGSTISSRFGSSDGAFAAAESDAGAEAVAADESAADVQAFGGQPSTESTADEAVAAGHPSPFQASQSTVRFLRSLAPWSAPGGQEDDDRGG